MPVAQKLASGVRQERGTSRSGSDDFRASLAICPITFRQHHLSRPSDERIQHMFNMPPDSTGKRTTRWAMAIAIQGAFHLLKQASKTQR